MKHQIGAWIQEMNQIGLHLYIKVRICWGFIPNLDPKWSCKLWWSHVLVGTHVMLLYINGWTQSY